MVTTAPDISPEAVERIALNDEDWARSVLKYTGNKDAAEGLDRSAAALRALRSALTASGELLQKVVDDPHSHLTLGLLADITDFLAKGETK